MIDAFGNNPHRRWNPLRKEWIIVSPHRTQRPWQGQIENVAQAVEKDFDPTCYLCPGNTRANGDETPRYESTFVFQNDFAALKPEAVEATMNLENAGLLCAATERGICRVLCFHPRHDLTLATMSVDQIIPIVEMWAEQVAELGAMPEIQYVQVFENRGAMMGASNPHPHGQIWATEHIPNEPLAELKTQQTYFAEHGEPMLKKYLELELKQRERIVAENGTWLVLVPFWAVWPFETLVLPRSARANFAELDPQERVGLAEILHLLTAGYNRVFSTPFPYSMGFHVAPTDGRVHPEWVMHAHFYPPLLRSATVRKFMVGFELLGSSQRDITPESAAETLCNMVVR
jgi:UDPglucose--hexose-1-phosphate uridylyltransferase